MKTQHTSSRGRFDRGNILPMTLIMMVLGSLIVTALMAFAITILRNRPPLEERSDSLEAVRSAMRMAIVMQRDHGPDGCYDSSTDGFRVNNRDVIISCESLATENDNGGRFGLIATTNNGFGNGAAPDNEAIRNETGNTAKSIRGSVFVNGGQLGGNNATWAVTEGDVIGSTYSSTETSMHRYAALDPATDIDVAPATTCSSLFGPDVQQLDVFGPAFNYVAPIDFNNTATALRITPDAGTSIVGVMHTNLVSQWTLDRSVTNTGNGRFDVYPPLGLLTIADVRVCYQQVPDTDPIHIPTDLTFCDSPLVDPELFDQTDATAPEGITCQSEPWWTYAGWKPNLRPNYIYPFLPQIPSYPRSSTPVRVGTTDCYVLYPGRYESEIVLDGNGGTNQFYFASGVYLLNKPLTVTNGARVLVGEGKRKGCAFDADAAFLSGSPRNHEITGKGATLLLGSDGTGSTALADNGSINVVDSSFQINNRVATNSTRASSGLSVMSINLATNGTEPGDVEIPADDRVLLPGCLASEVLGDPAVAFDDKPECAESIATYSVTPNGAGSYATPVGYEPSQLDADDSIINIQLNGAPIGRNRVTFLGNVFVPNSRIEMSTNRADDAYRVRMRDGAVASSYDFDFPVGGTDSVVIGQETAVVYEKLKLVAATTFDDRDFRSVVEVEVDTSNRYAINNWTVDAGSGDATSTGTTNSGTTTTVAPATTIDTGTPTTTIDTGTPTTTIDGSSGTTTTTSTTTTTTVPPTTSTTTTTTTLPPVPEHDFCSEIGGGWTRYFGDGEHWDAEFRNIATFNSQPSDTFGGAPDATAEVGDVDYYPGGGSFAAGVNDDYFSARLTRTVNFADECGMWFAVGADDGYRLFIDGVELFEDWSNHGHRWTWDWRYMTAGEHELVIEYYEKTGTASLDFRWSRG